VKKRVTPRYTLREAERINIYYAQLRPQVFPVSAAAVVVVVLVAVAVTVVVCNCCCHCCCTFC